MGIALLVGTQKGLVVLRPDANRQNWSFAQFCLNGWKCGAATQDADGLTYVGVSNDVYGAAIVVSEDLENWQQRDSAPRYAATDRGDPSHNRIIGSEDPLGMFEGGGRFVDQIWKLHANGNALYAGVSEAGLFVSHDRGESWDGVPGERSSCKIVLGTGFRRSVRALHPGRLRQFGPDVGGNFCGRRLPHGRRGKSWQQRDEGVNPGSGYCVHALAHDPQNADVIYRQDHRGMYRTDDGGDRWVLIENGLPQSQLSDEHVCAFGFPVAMDRRTDSVYNHPARERWVPLSPRRQAARVSYPGQRSKLDRVGQRVAQRQLCKRAARRHGHR